MCNSYHIKEIFYSLQGEGFHAGTPAVFVRFTGCNLSCEFCDTDFIGTDGKKGGVYTVNDLVGVVSELASWEAVSKGRKNETTKGRCSQTRTTHDARPMTILTGGEPLLQVDKPLIDALHAAGFYIAVETNGTQIVPQGIDWICVSPKPEAKMVVSVGNELKLVYPQNSLDPSSYLFSNFDHYYLQPKDDADREENTKKCMQYCLENPRWKLSLQLHKILNIK